LLLASCELQTLNSVREDASVYGDLGGSPAFKGIRAIMRERCLECHEEFLSYHESDFISQGYVVAGNPAGSQIYSVLRGSGVGGEEDMPEDSTLEPDQIEAFRAWIDGL
jgi:hypothetical protein